MFLSFLGLLVRVQAGELMGLVGGLWSLVELLVVLLGLLLGDLLDDLLLLLLLGHSTSRWLCWSGHAHHGGGFVVSSSAAVVCCCVSQVLWLK